MNKLEKIFEKLIKDTKKSREWRTFVFCLAAIVVFTTTYSLILPAITVEKNATDSVGGLVTEEANPGSTGAGAEVSEDVVTVEAETEPSDTTEPADAVEEAAESADSSGAASEEPSEASSAASAPVVTEAPAEETTEYREPYNGEVQTYGDRRVMYLTGDDFDVMVSGDLSVGVADGTILSVRGIPDQAVVKSYSDRISEELLKLYVDRKTTEVLYQLVFTDKDQYEYTPTGYFDIQFYFHRNTVDHSRDLVYAAIYNYMTDEMLLAEKNGDVYETPVITLDEHGVITGINLKGINFHEFSDIVTLVAGPVNEELRLAAEKAAQGTDSEPKAEGSADSKSESGGEKAETTESRTESKSESGKEKAETTESKSESDREKAESSESKSESEEAKTESSESKSESEEAKAESSESKSEKAESEASEENQSEGDTSEEAAAEGDADKETASDAAASGGAAAEESAAAVSAAKNFNFTINRKETFKLSAIAETLGLAGTDRKYAAGSDFVRDVEDVAFTDESLVRVRRSGIFGTSVWSGGDWTIRGLRAFESEEYLTVTMKGGAVYTIRIFNWDNAQELTAECGEYTVTVSLPESAPAGEYTVTAEKVGAAQDVISSMENVLTEDLGNGIVKNAKIDKSSVELLDITIYKDGVEYEPEGPVQVNVRKADGSAASGASNGAAAGQGVIHFASEADPEILTVQDGSFTTESFSIFAVGYTVDFTYEGYAYSIQGGGQIALSGLMEVLGINADVLDVADAVFTDPSLLTVEKVAENTVITHYVDSGAEITFEMLEALEGDNVLSIDKEEVKETVYAGDWILTSLKPFTSSETLTIAMADGSKYIVAVEDEQYNGIEFDTANNTVNLTDVSILRMSASKTVTQNEQDRNASIDFGMGAMITKAGLEAIQEYIRETGKVPAIVYDYSSALQLPGGAGAIGNPVTGQDTLKENGQPVGTATYTADGKVIIQYTDPAWVLRKTSIGANATVSIQTDANKIPADDKWDFEFPDSNTITVKYKSTTSTEAKQFTLSGDGATGYTASYTAKFTNTANMTSLKFTDSLGSDDLQTLNAGSIKITKDGNDVTSSFTKTTDGKGFTLENTNNPGAGEYVVTYTTSITAAQYEQMQEGQNSQETNTCKWNVNGSKEVPGGETSFNIEKPRTPEPEVSVSKTSNKENQEVDPGGDIYYTVEYKTTKINGLRILDTMTDLQVLDRGSLSITIDGRTISTPNDFVNYNNDNSFSTGNTNVFDYTFPDTLTGELAQYNYDKSNPVEHTIRVTYKTTVIDKETAKANNVYDIVSVKNMGQEGRNWTSDTTESPVTYDKEVIHVVDKSVSANNVTADGKWEPGATLTYTLKIGDGTTDLSNVRVVDRMTDLQVLDRSSVQIKYGDYGSYTPLTEGIVFDDDGQYSTNDTNVLDFVLPASAGNGPVYITYRTTVISQDKAKELGIYGEKQVKNFGQAGGKGGDGTDGPVPFEEEPKYPLVKTVDTSDAEKDDETGNVQLGSTVHYHVEFGDSTISNMAGVKIRDDMTDVQKLSGDVTVTLSEPLAADVTFDDGTVWEAGNTVFTMPTATSKGAENGVVWAAYEDDAKYSLTQTARVFYFTMPEGVGRGPIKVDYDVTVITEQEAKDNGINDTHNVKNTAVSGNNTQETEYPVDFPKNFPHTPKVEKAWVDWDFDKKAVIWDITVDKTADSAFPLTNVKVTEVLSNNSFVNSSEINNTKHAIIPSEIDMLGAVVTTASGKILSMGEDYEVYRGSDPVGPYGNPTEPYFLFYELDEPVTIRMSFATTLAIIDGFETKNTVKVDGGNTAFAEKKYDAPEFTIAKSGEIVSTPDQPDLKDRVIKWTVMINPTKMEVEPDTDVYFNDEIPEGLKVIDYSEWKDSGRIITANSSIMVGYDGIMGGLTQEIDVTVDDGEINGVKINPDLYHGNPAPTKLNKQKYTIEYYTYIDEAEWQRITSSASGSKTYPNTATVEAGGTEKTGKTEVTISSDTYISKTDTTQTGDYEGKDGRVHTGVVVKYDEDEGKLVGSDEICYRIEVNPNAAALNRVDNGDGSVTYAPLTLSDRIDTNMDFEPNTLKIYRHGGEGVAADTEKEDSELTLVDAEAEGIVVSYNDDSRMLTISGLKDKTAYRIAYNNVVRAQGQDTFTNTATLTGGGSHSSTVSEQHKIEVFNDDTVSYDMDLKLRKIIETNITRYLPNVTFELHKLTLAVDTETFTDAQWEALYNETNAAGYVADPRFKIINNQIIDTVVTTDENKGIVDLGKDIKIEPKTVYYWIETKNENPGFEAEMEKHYFTLYPEMQIVWLDEEGNVLGSYDPEDPTSAPDGAVRVAKVMLDDQQKTHQQHIAWALDNAATAANGITVASQASGATWSVTNVETKYTSISARKIWVGDNNNLYQSRPSEGIRLTLMQKEGEDGEWTVYSSETTSNPVIVRASTYEVTENGNKVIKEEWPNTNWAKLPAYSTVEVDDGNGGTKEVKDKDYFYKVVESPVSDYATDYTTTYSTSDGSEVDLENVGIPKGTVVITNTYIPPTTKISVHKNFSVSEGTQLPEQVVMNLYQYKEDADGNVTGPTDYGYTMMLTAQNNWTATFEGLPTRDSNGNNYSYTVVEDTDALEEAGFTYSFTEYELDGSVKKDKDGNPLGLVSGTVEVTNHGPGRLKITKNVTINGVEVTEGDTGADGEYTFTITDKDGNPATGKVNDEEIVDGQVTVTVENGVAGEITITDMPSGEYTVHEEIPADAAYTLTSGNDVKVKVIGDNGDPEQVIASADFMNNYEKTRVRVEKTWINANRDADGEQINGTNHDWPKGKTLTMTLYKTNGTDTVLVETKKDGSALTNPAILNAANQFHIFDDLAELEEGWTYTVVEDPVEGYDTNVNPIDEDGVIKVFNSEHTKLQFTKKWENTTWNETDHVKYNRLDLRIKVKLTRYYEDENGELVVSPYSTEKTEHTFLDEDGQTHTEMISEEELFGREMVLYGETRNHPEWGDNAMNETSKKGSDEWTLFWEDLPTTGEVDGKTVEYIYKAEETELYYSNRLDDSLDPGTGQHINHMDDECWETVTSEDGLTITNIYTDDVKSVSFEKVWSDGNDRHGNDWVDIQLYRSKYSPSGYGRPFTGTVQVDTSSWLDTKGNPASAPTGSVEVTVTDTTTGEAVGTYTLAENSWSTTFEGINGHVYSVECTAADGIATTAQSSTTITGAHPTVTVKGRVPAPAYKIYFNNNSTPLGQTENTSAVITAPIFPWVVDQPTFTITSDNSTPNVENISHSIDPNNLTVTINLEGLSGDVILWVTESYKIDGSPVLVPDEGSGGSGSTDTFPEEPEPEVTQTIPEDSEMEKVPSADAGTATAIALHKGSDDTYEGVTYKAINGLWEYSWAGLPAVDPADGEPWFYYVKEMHYGSGAATPTEVSETTYAYEYADSDDMAVTKVIATNVVVGGELKVTKSASGYDGVENKSFSFYVQAEDGSYVQNTEGDLGSRVRYFSLKSGETVTFPNLPVGTYTVVEDERGAKVTGYELTATGGGEVTVTKNASQTAALTNSYEKETGSITVNKTALFNEEPDEEAIGQTVTVGLFTSEQSAETPLADRPAATETKVITLASMNDGAAVGGSASFEKLEFGTYYVYEVDENNKAILNGETATVGGIEYTVVQGGSSSELTLNEKTASINISNERIERTGPLSVTKTLTASTPAGDSNKAFTFTITFSGDGAADMVGQTYATTVTETGKDDVTGSVTVTQGENSTAIAEITVKPGQTLTIAELPLVTYSVAETDEDGYQVSASSGTTGTLTTEGAEASFTNTYSASGEAKVTAQKVFTNGAAITEGQFTFNLQEYTNSTYSQTTGSPQTLSVAANTGIAESSAIVYTDEGTHYYKLTENLPAGTTPTAADKTAGYIIVDGIKYDLTEHTIVDTVTDNGNGTLKIMRSIDSGTAAEYTYNEQDPAVEVTFTNEQLGTLKIKKSVEGAPASQNLPHTYSFTVKNSDNKWIKADGSTSDTEVMLPLNVTQPSGNTLTIKNLPLGTYTVTEYENGAQITGYALTVVSDPADGSATLTTSDLEKTVGFTNTYKEAKIVIKKTIAPSTITGEDLAALKEKISFTIEDTASENKSPAQIITIDKDTDGFDSIFTANGLELTKEDGILYGHTYRVTEMIESDDKYTLSTSTYQVTANGTAGDETTGTVANVTMTTTDATDYTADQVIAFTNTYEEKPGSLKLKKKVEVNRSEFTTSTSANDKALTNGTYTFTITGDAVDGNEDPKVTRVVTITFVNGEITEAKVGESAASLSEATLTDGWVVVDKLPADTYTITEEPPENGTSLVGTNDVRVVVSKGDTEGVKTAEFTNNINTGNLELAKTVSGKTDTATAFNFTIKLTPPEGVTLAGTYPATVAGDDTVTSVTVTNNTVTQALKAGQTLTITGLPEGTGSVITEDDYSSIGYSQGAKANLGTAASPARIPAGDTLHASVVNVFEAENTTSFTVKKTFTDGDLSQNTFTFRLTQVTGDNSTTQAEQNVKLADPVEVSTDTATGGADQTLQFELPAGFKFTQADIGKTFWFMIEEVVPTGTTLDANNIDQTKDIQYAATRAQWVSVKITEQGGKLIVTKTPNKTQDASFTNVQLGEVKVQKNATKAGKKDSSNTGTFWFGLSSTENTFTRVADTENVSVTANEAAKVGWGDLPIGTYYVFEMKGNTGTDANTPVDTNFGAYTVSGSGEAVTLSSTQTSATAQITNDKELVDIDAEKTWKDSLGSDITATITNAEVKFKLQKKVGQDGTYADATEIDEYTKTLKVDGTASADKSAWKASWTGLPKYEDGKLVYYQVVEEIVTPSDAEAEALSAEASDYVTPAAGNPKATVGLTNTLPETEVTANKQWLNAEGTEIEAGSLPDGATVTFAVYAGTETDPIATVVLDGTAADAAPADTAAAADSAYESSAWEATFKNLPKYDSTGTEIIYTVKETVGYNDFTNIDPDGVSTNETIRNKEGAVEVPLEAVKTMKGGEVPADGKYKFTLTAQDGAPMPTVETERATSPMTISNTNERVDSVTTSKAVFGTIHFTPSDMTGATEVEGDGNENKLEKTFIYTVAEVDESAANTNIRYDPAVYTVRIKVIYDTVTGQMQAVDPTYQKKVGDAAATTEETLTFQNEEITQFQFTKEWRQNGSVIEWPSEDEAQSITVTLRGSAGGVNKDVNYVVTSDGITAATGAEIFEGSTAAKENGGYIYTISSLPKYDGSGNAYTYSISEEQVSGYNKPAYFTTTTEAWDTGHAYGDEENTFVSAGQTGGVKIVNDQITTSLPHTGGSGTGTLTLLGIMLLAFAAAMYGYTLQRKNLLKGGDPRK